MKKKLLGCLLLLAVTFSGCQAKLYHYSDQAHKVSISYPGTVDLISEPEVLESLASPLEASLDQPRLLFVLVTPQESRLSCTVHHLPEGLALTAEEYYQASTASELEELKAEVIEPKTDVVINGRVFQKVGFLAKVDEVTTLHVRIYQHFDPKTRRVLVLTPMAETSDWDKESALLESVVESVQIDW